MKRIHESRFGSFSPGANTPDGYIEYYESYHGTRFADMPDDRLDEIAHDPDARRLQRAGASVEIACRRLDAWRKRRG